MFCSARAFEGQQHAALKRQCLQSGLLFEDPCFPAVDDSLFYQGNRIGRVVWKRPRVSSVYLIIFVHLICLADFFIQRDVLEGWGWGVVGGWGGGGWD